MKEVKKTENRIAVRVDGDAYIGIGHVMRCLSIADEFRKQGYGVCFISASREAEDIINGRGYGCMHLDSAFDNTKAELPELLSLLDATGVEVILVDTYYASAAYLRELSKNFITVYIDDFCKETYPVDVVVNYNIYARTLGYESRYGCCKTKLLLGSAYAPVRPGFKNTVFKVRDKVKKILVTMGGSDSHNIAGMLAKKIAEERLLDNIEVKIVCGRLNQHIGMLLKLENQYQNISVYYDVQDMAGLMCRCDIAVIAAGTTMYEACTVGIPIITCSYADNQVLPAKAFETEIGIINAGDYRAGANEMLEKITKAIFLPQDERKKLSGLMKTKVDGRGTERLVREIVAIIQDKQE